MEKTKENTLHLGKRGRIDIVCDPALKDEIEQYFSVLDVGLGKVNCFGAANRYKLSLFFDIAGKGLEVAKAIMGLLNRNDIEIEMHCSTADGASPVKSIKLRKADDVEKCKELLDKCAAISVHKKETEKGGK
ncbi:hypothetical protein NI370_001781 [Salmonella enterica]|nr:hypothetical protein [Salmonella enterica]EJJ4106069.1 hypothetical protein [Salmonella enterica]EJJ4359354.1 hypothetical protein [Salmonella enterica]EJJ4381852.1 hypothetical protein [Salmonella enterica]EJJ4580484.1 hypothetical protein [Salmonella enterica]